MESRMQNREKGLFVAIGTQIVAVQHSEDRQLSTACVESIPSDSSSSSQAMQIKTNVDENSDPIMESGDGEQDTQLEHCTDRDTDSKETSSDVVTVPAVSDCSENCVSRGVIYTLPNVNTVISKPSKLAETLWAADKSTLDRVVFTESAAAVSGTTSHTVIKEDYSGLAIQFLAQRAAQHVLLAESLQSKRKISLTIDAQSSAPVPSAVIKKRQRLGASVEEESSPSHTAGPRKQRSYTHTGVRTCVCEICNAILSAPASLKTHMLIHSGSKPYSCVMCDATFRHQSTLKRHMCIHTGEKKFTCEICHSPFARKTELTQHQRSHSTARPFMCKICGSSYKHPKDLSQHLRAHARNMPCKDSCSQKEHTDSNTHENSSLSCDICRAKCDSINALTQHMLRKHVSNISVNSPSENQADEDFANMCSVCGMKMENATLLSLHIQESHFSEQLKLIAQSPQDSDAHEHSCKKCNSQFATGSALTQHIKQKHWFSLGESQQDSDDLHICTCSVCGMEYPRLKSLTQHMKKSHGINLLPCSKCGTSFVQMQDWLDHIKLCS